MPEVQGEGVTCYTASKGGGGNSDPGLSLFQGHPEFAPGSDA